MELTKEQWAILHHTKYRAANGFYCGDSTDMQALMAEGLMESAGKAAYCPDEYFQMTSRGRHALSSRNEPLQTATTGIRGYRGDED